MRRVPGFLLVFSMLVFLISAVGAVEVGPGSEVRQWDNSVSINFSQQLNFTPLNIYPGTTQFGNSNFTAEPGNSLDIALDFYDHNAGGQEFVSNFSASYSSSQEVNFSLGNLPSSDFYEAFETGTGTRIFIGYTDSNSFFNFSDTFSSKDISVFNYGEKGVEANSIYFNSSDPEEFDAIEASINLSNEGVVDPENPNTTLKVETYNGTEWIDTEFFDNTFTVPDGGWSYVNFTWTAKPGPWRFRFEADPGDAIKETDETNNQNSTIYEVGSYEIFYGGSDTKLELGAGNDNIHVWGPSTEKGNLFFVDYDSSFSFADLEPLGDNNFSTADQALNLTGHNDSISEEWDQDSDGTADQTKTYDIGQRSLTVPVINSTSDGSWKTGILYDSADGTPYDGSQDLAFVTEINDSTQGKYGIYDYEAKVPATLRDLKKGTSSVQIYSEIK